MKDYQTLVRQAQSTEESERRLAFDELVKRFQNMAYQRAYEVLGDQFMAEDAMQDAFLTAYMRINQLREPAAFPGWLKRIVLTQCDRLTRGYRPIIESLDTRFDLASEHPTPEDALETLEIQRRIQKAIGVLPEHERAVTEGFYMQGVSQKELAERLEVPVTTVKKRLQYARQRLRLLMGELNAAVDQALLDMLHKHNAVPKQQPAYLYDKTPSDDPRES